MKRMISKIVLFTAAMFLVGLASLSSTEYQKDNVHDGDFNQKAKTNQNRNINPSASPKLDNAVGIFIEADYIFYKTSTGNSVLDDIPNRFELTQGGVITTSGSASTPTRLQYNWASGFKVGLGCNFEYGNWILDAEYTWLRPSAHLTLKSVGTDFDFIKGAPLTTAFKDHLDAKEDLKFNNITLKLGSNYYINKHLTFYPYAGLLGTWQELESSRYSPDVNIGDLSKPFATNFRDTLKSTDKIWGIGPLFGTELGLIFGKGFSLFAKLSGASAFQSQNIKAEVILKDGIISAAKTNVYEVSKETVYGFSPWLSCALGLKYSTYFSNNQYHLSIQAGWESQWWGNWLTKIDESLNSTANLNLGGLDVKIRFDF